MRRRLALGPVTSRTSLALEPTSCRSPPLGPEVTLLLMLLMVAVALTMGRSRDLVTVSRSWVTLVGAATTEAARAARAVM
ncbi:hypothetical protein BDW72DRAFT_166652 [Aspergillus terricola var. indicus]